MYSVLEPPSESILEDLHSDSVAAVEQACQVLKNQIVGSLRRKRAMATSIPRLVEIAISANTSSEERFDFLADIVIAFGSFALGGIECEDFLIESDVVGVIFGIMERVFAHQGEDRQARKLKFATLRSLRNLLSCDRIMCNANVRRDLGSHIGVMVDALEQGDDAVREGVALVLHSVKYRIRGDASGTVWIPYPGDSDGKNKNKAKEAGQGRAEVCTDMDVEGESGRDIDLLDIHWDHLERSVKVLSQMVKTSSAGSQSAALWALNAMIQAGGRLEDLVTGGDNCRDSIAKLVRSSHEGTRLAACACIANLIPRGAPKEYAVRPAAVLPATIGLLGGNDARTREIAPLVLAKLAKNSPGRQKSICESLAIQRLLASVSLDKISNAQKINSFRALAAICSSLEEGRRAVDSTEIYVAISKSFANPSDRVKVAALKVLRYLTRSVKILRTSDPMSGLMEIVLKCLEVKSTKLSKVALSCLCNMTLEFSPARDNFLEANGLERVVPFARSPDVSVRTVGLWVLKNFSFQAADDVKKRLLGLVSIEEILGMVDDENQGVSAQAACLMRNLAYGDDSDIWNLLENEHFPHLVASITRRVNNATPSPPADDATLLHILYLIVNTSAHSLKFREAFSNDALLSRYNALLKTESPETIIALCWVVTNLIWKVEPDETGIRDRLKSAGLMTSLGDLAKDQGGAHGVDVRDRAKCAINLFEGRPETPLDA